MVESKDMEIAENVYSLILRPLLVRKLEEDGLTENEQRLLDLADDVFDYGDEE